MERIWDGEDVGWGRDRIMGKHEKQNYDHGSRDYRIMRIMRISHELTE